MAPVDSFGFEDPSATMNEAQIAFLVLYLVYVAITLLFHTTLAMYPFRLLTTFLHEMSHALACWVTCGDVRSIQVFGELFYPLVRFPSALRACASCIPSVSR